MRKGYGNYFDDVNESIKCEILRKRVDKGCELSKARLNNITDKLSKDLNTVTEAALSHYEGSIGRAVCIMDRNVIKNRLALVYISDNMRLEVIKCLDRITKAEKGCAEDKLKALVYLNLKYKHSFRSDYWFMSKILTSVFVSILENDSILLSSEPCLRLGVFHLALPNAISNLLSGLTLREVLNVFPLEKKYDGEKYCRKDYFSSMDSVSKIGLDTVLTSKLATEFIMSCLTNDFMFNCGTGFMKLASDYKLLSVSDIIDTIKEPSKPTLKVIK